MRKWHRPAAAGALRKRLEYDADPLARIPHDGSWADGFIRDLYAEHGPALHAYVQQLGAGYHDAEEVVQETMVRAWRNARLLDPATGSIRGWLYTVARHILIDRLRIRTATPIGVEPRDAESAVSDHQEMVVERINVLNALSGLSAEHRMAVVEVYYRGRTVESVAKSLGVPSGTIRSRLFYGLRHLRTIFESGHFGEDEVAGS
ncbi:MAG TPA: sigma-70 family RNA polymerase sigma factor [Streptosporangiaceae bacterium]|nr:sigma-70 family RNA polymerase sigma factor [Streptosporangiaceae bacterium]